MIAAERSEFERKVQYLRMAFPDLQEVKIVNKKEELGKINVMMRNGEERNLSRYLEVMIIGNRAYNIVQNSVATNLDIIILDKNGSEPIGFIGFI